MGMVVLHLNQRKILLAGVPGGGIFGVKIAGNQFRLDIEESIKLLNGFDKIPVRNYIGELSQVFADNGFVLVIKADSGFHLSAQSQ
jgi:hypothetical protein